MTSEDLRRRDDLGAFLRARRAAVAPEQLGMAPGPRRRTPGLRREEVALVAGVSVSWYTWLEQGRPINASTEVLSALARVLQLDDTGRAHLVALARPDGDAVPAPNPTTDAPASAGRPPVPPSLWRLLDQLAPSPAYVLGPHWDYLGWNAAFAALFPPVGDLPDPDRNLVWAVLAHPDAHALIVGWEDEARRVLSQFRAATVAHRRDPAFVDLVARLHDASPAFASWWPDHDVAAPDTRIRRFAHPDAGDLSFAFQALVPADAPELLVVVHLPLADDDSTERLAAVSSVPS